MTGLEEGGSERFCPRRARTWRSPLSPPGQRVGQSPRLAPRPPVSGQARRQAVCVPTATCLRRQHSLQVGGQQQQVSRRPEEGPALRLKVPTPGHIRVERWPGGRVPSAATAPSPGECQGLRGNVRHTGFGGHESVTKASCADSGRRASRHWDPPACSRLVHSQESLLATGWTQACAVPHAHRLGPSTACQPGPNFLGATLQCEALPPTAPHFLPVPSMGEMCTPGPALAVLHRHRPVDFPCTQSHQLCACGACTDHMASMPAASAGSCPLCHVSHGAPGFGPGRGLQPPASIPETGHHKKCSCVTSALKKQNRVYRERQAGGRPGLLGAVRPPPAFVRDSRFTCRGQEGAHPVTATWASTCPG